MDYLSQAKFWDATAGAAEFQLRHVKDPLAMDSWLMIADTCRQLAGQFRDLAKEQISYSANVDQESDDLTL